MQAIVLLDYSRPLAERAGSRKIVGPYRWTPNDRRNGAMRNTSWKGVGFYQHSRFVAVDPQGSTFDLRLDYANTHHPMNWRRSGTFQIGDHGAFTAIVARLPHGRGFLAGWTLGHGMAACLDGTVWETIEDAARAAYDEAERACEDDAEYQARLDEEEAA